MRDGKMLRRSLLDMLAAEGLQGAQKTSVSLHGQAVKS
jgi:hypothetical protein